MARVLLLAPAVLLSLVACAQRCSSSSSLSRSVRKPNAVRFGSRPSVRSPDSQFSFHHPYHSVSLCSTPQSSIFRVLFRGAFLRVASDLTGGTVFENIKTRAATKQGGQRNPLDIARAIIRQDGWKGLWRGTPSRLIEGSLVGAVFLASSTMVKRQLLQQQLVQPATASLLAGLAGGVAQAIVMTPTTFIFTAVNASPDTSTLQVVRSILKEKGLLGLYAAGGQSLILRQATNWASRSGLTEIMRPVFKSYGLVGELASGVVGGVGSCWNTPIETIRVRTQSDVSNGKPAKPIQTHWREIVQLEGYRGLFKGVTPRAFQAVWQTVFLIVVPNLIVV